MKLDKKLFDQIAKQAVKSSRLRMHYDLRDSETENGQRMLNVLLPGTKSAIHRHVDTSEVVVCIFGSAIERFYDNEGKEVEMVVMKAGSDIPGVWIEQGRYHSLEATDEMGVIFEAKAHKYNPLATEQKL
ncbi:WbuC family cupin fold metalloprotein [uncultured Bacteroides sp.]|uniref:WbuC family cupin fold metalloprotein n=1 Tax=uncultured Bacteroides sp. TaxID=162156 RepID=UPI0026747451|nr:WbuC family cupin fold metalloprotein [uncultured Bacteroides sp.]